ncbi:MAG TPA: DUF885 domain-containing protein [Methylomirabilota bacterium]|nr:DUF885 domain-containing protein [Methylomirabilota bacterium]
MIRVLTMMALSIGSASMLMPMILFAQGAANEKNSAATRKFRVYLEEDWKRWMVEYPELATAAGFPGQNRRWSDDSPAGIETRKKHLHESAAALKGFSRDSLPHAEQINYDLYSDLLSTAEEGLQYGDDPLPFRNVVPHNNWMPISQMGGVQQGAAETISTMPNRSVADYENILARLEALPTYVEQQQTSLQEGLKRGYTPPKLMLRDVPKQIADLIPADPLASALLEPFKNFSVEIPEQERTRLTNRATEIYRARVAPAFQKLHDYVVSTYLPACRESIAATALPNGAEGYAFHVRWQTTTHLTPQEIHEIGLSEVKRIRADMDKVIASTNFKGSFHEFTEFLRNDPRFYFDKPDDLVNGYRIIAKKIDPELAHLFGKLPRLPYGVTPIPDFKAPSQTTAYYQAGAPSVGRPGYYFVNAYNLHARPKWEMEALSLHESVPGHHLQISLAQEMENEPEFRKHVGYSAFVEGWALYCESLGEELGMYKDPYSKFGQLSYEMWRAVRLVVDTGMHAQGWTRDQAIQFFKDNTGKTDQDITVEVDRYIVWPGQALAYKLGQLKIRELRAQAEKRQGTKFNVRAFHDAVLENGALPLNVLTAHIENWMAAAPK